MKPYVPYWEKLLDPRWQKKRLEVMHRDEFACKECGAKDKTLNVHHKIYRKNLEPWEYQDAELITVCSGCHEKYEEMRDLLIEILFSRTSLQDLECLYDCLSAFSNPTDCGKVLNGILLEMFMPNAQGGAGGPLSPA